MKFDWKYRYVDNGIKPDKHKRWALDLFVFFIIDKKNNDYKKLNAIYGKYMPVKVAVIKLNKKDNLGKFYSTINSLDLDYSLGQQTFYSDDLNELKNIIETQYTDIKYFFKNFR